MQKPPAAVPSPLEIRINEQDAEQRLDNFLFRHLKSVPKSHVYLLVRKGQVRVNGKRHKPDYRLEEGDIVQVPPVRQAETIKSGRPPELMLNRIKSAILYESPDLLVINKPSGVAVHGGSGVSFGVIELLRAVYPDAPFLELVHRLDRDTSGCLMVARKRSVLRFLHQHLRDTRAIEKSYLALVMGRWPERKRQVSAALQKSTLQSGERRVRVADEGRASVTEFTVKERFADTTLVEARPITGRTHQIRVHAAHVGHPIAGDEKYNTDEANHSLRAAGLTRLFLHAAALTFPLPNLKQPLSLHAPLPAELERVLSKLRG